MKRFFIISVAALVAMCACTKNEVNLPEQEISFKVANYLNQTKAGEKKYVGCFGTFAFQIPEGMTWSASANATSEATATSVATDKDKTVYMNNVEISDHQGVWKSEAVYYWPKTGSLTFASYSPVSTKAACRCSVSCGLDAVIKVENWTVNTVYSAQAKDYTEDLMYADVITDQKSNKNPAVYGDVSGVSEGVPTLFHHALAKVNLQAKAADVSGAYTYAIYIDNVAIKDILYSGSYQVGAGWTRSTNVGSDPNIYAYTVPAFANGDVYADKATTAALSGDAKSLFDNYFVLPQTLANASVINISFTIVTIGADGKVVLVEKANSGDIKINDMGLKSWDENKNITYTVTINPVGSSLITFDPVVSEWDSVTGTDITIG